MTDFQSYIKVSDFPALPDELAIFRPTNGMLSYSQAIFKDLKGVVVTGPQKGVFAGQCIDVVNVHLMVKTSSDVICHATSIQHPSRHRWRID